MKFHSPTQLPDGHTIWQVEGISQIAISDKSGATPDQTDDGVMYLDFDKSLMLDGHCVIPLIELNRVTSTLSDPATIVALSSRFNWAVNVRGILFKFNRVDGKSNEVEQKLREFTKAIAGLTKGYTAGLIDTLIDDARELVEDFGL